MKKFGNFMKIKPLVLAATVAGIISTFGGNASAAPVVLDGDGFSAIYDDAIVSLFGTPTLSGDGKTILFSPLSFKATASGTQGAVFANSNTQFDIILDNNQKLTGVSLIENGDYRLVNRDGDPAPAVDVSGELRLTNLYTGTDTNIVNFTAGTLSTVCTSLNGCGLTPWATTASIGAPDAWVDNLGNPVDVRVRLQNDLTAESYQVRDIAEIEKKHASQTVAITPHLDTVVPVPGAVWLFGSAMAGFIGLRRKQQTV
jgi:hypothetical protein